MRTCRGIARLVVWNLAIALAATVLLQVFRQDVTWRDIARQYQYSLVYTFAIATPAWLLMARIAPQIMRLGHYTRIPVLAGVLAVLAFLGSLAANVFFVAAGWQTWREFRPEFDYGLRIALFLTLLIGTLSAVFEMLRDRLQAAKEELRRRQLEDERARQLVTQARLSSLESRIHPHFLFNTLNSISALIREDPPQAERTVERLAALLRYSLDHHANGLVPLRQEFRVVEDYLEIEKTRFGDRLKFTLEAPAELADLDVPPLALQLLVENSIKHAIAASRQGGEIRVRARLEPGGLRMEVEDDGPGFDPARLAPGHGLENLRERLAALFDGRGRLEMARRAHGMSVAVLVPQGKALT